MKPISARPIFTLSFLNPKSSHHFSFFSTVGQQQSPVANYSPRRYEDESRSVRVSVFWDFENCSIPCNFNVFRVAQCVTNAIRVNGIKGPIQITAFGDVLQISRNNQEALSSTGINLIHVPSGGKNSADRSLLVDLMYWVTQNPPPAHLFLISGDRDFSGILHRLRMNNYNILLASPQNAPPVLCSAATIMWQWSSLLKGENLTGKLFNQPPDGPYSSWYGHYKAPLEDPFSLSEKSSCLPAEESSSELIKPQPIPKAVVKQIQQILNKYPEGINISVLRVELNKNVTVDKNLYGYKKFSRFLFALGDILKIHPQNDGIALVCGVSHNIPNENVEAAITHGDCEVITPTSEISSIEDLNGNLTVLPVQEPKAKAQTENLIEDHKENKQNNMKVKSCATNLQELKKEKKWKESMKEIRAHVKNVNLQRAEKEEMLSESSPPKNLQGVKVETCAINSQELKKEEKLKESSPQRNMPQDKNVDFQPKEMEVVSPPVGNKEFSEINEKHLNASDKHNAVGEPGFLRRLWNKWFKPRDTNSSEKSCQNEEKILSGVDKVEENQTMLESDDKFEKVCENVDNMKVHSKELELFSKESFWNELGSFIDASGSTVILQSTSRDQLAQNLRKQGPFPLRNLSEDHVLHLVHLLISDKKWVQEVESTDCPFKLTRPAGKDKSNDSPNGLSHIFSGRKPSLQELIEKKYQTHAHTGVLQRVSSRKPRSEILKDVQKLLDDHIKKEYPEGFPLESFRELFLEKNGYALDLQKLGYDKLSNLVQIMPGVRIKSNLIVPIEPFKTTKNDVRVQESKVGPVVADSFSSNLQKKDDCNESSWDELGPVDDSGPKKKLEEIVSAFSRKAENGWREQQKLPDYEPLKEDEFTDSDEDGSSSSIKPENGAHKSSGVKKDDDSSLLQILDSWYERTDKDDELVVGRPQASGFAKGGPGNAMRNHKGGKSFSFVAEEEDSSSSGKDKMVDGILESFKKSSDKSAESPRILG